MDEGMWSWKIRPQMTGWLRPWKWPSKGNRHPKNGHKIKEWRNIQWEISRRIKNKNTGLLWRNEHFLPNFNQNLLQGSKVFPWICLLFFPPAGSRWLESPGGEKSQQLWSQRETAAREAQEKNHWIAEKQPKILSTLKGPPIKTKTLTLYSATSFLLVLKSTCFLLEY